MRISSYIIVVLVLAGLLSTGCREEESADTSARVEPMADDAGTAAPVNRLTDEEAAEGWRLLFDGKTLDGWRGYGREDVPGGWGVAEDGSLFFNGESDGDLITDEQFESFELQLDWKISEGGNSGVFFHVAEGPDYPWRTGPEVQILDDERHPDARNGEDRLAGANYALHAPSKNVVHPAGEWNTLRVVVDGPHVEHWLNGDEVVTYELWSDDWKARVAASKFNDMPEYGMKRTGHIALQDHGNPVWFRNLKIRILDAGDDA